MWNSPASASCSKSGRGSSRVCSISGAARRIAGASSRAVSSGEHARLWAVLMGWIVSGRAGRRILAGIVQREVDGLLDRHGAPLSPGRRERRFAKRGPHLPPGPVPGGPALGEWQQRADHLTDTGLPPRAAGGARRVVLAYQRARQATRRTRDSTPCPPSSGAWQSSPAAVSGPKRVPRASCSASRGRWVVLDQMIPHGCPARETTRAQCRRAAAPAYGLPGCGVVPNDTAPRRRRACPPGHRTGDRLRQQSFGSGNVPLLLRDVPQAVIGPGDAPRSSRAKQRRCSPSNTPQPMDNRR